MSITQVQNGEAENSLELKFVSRLTHLSPSCAGNCVFSVSAEGDGGVNKQKQKHKVYLLQGEDRGGGSKKKNKQTVGIQTVTQV